MIYFDVARSAVSAVSKVGEKMQRIEVTTNTHMAQVMARLLGGKTLVVHGTGPDKKTMTLRGLLLRDTPISIAPTNVNSERRVTLNVEIVEVGMVCTAQFNFATGEEGFTYPVQGLKIALE